MAKKLSKILWHDTKVDGAGKPVLPSVATDDKGLNGLLPGELFMHVDKEKVSLWALSLSGEVVEVSGKTDEVDIDFSDYLLKSVWDSVFEIKTDVSGQKYIFGKLPVVTKYGITMYADDGNVEIPQLAEGLPYDQRTIWFNPETKQIEVIGGTGGGVADSVLWDNVEGKPSWITSTKPTYSYSEIQGTPDLSGYATTSSLNAVSTKLNDFLEGSDTDTVINKWKELETFLSGLTESDNLATILTGKADKSYVDTNFVTIAGTEDVTGLHNFVNGLKVGGLPITKKQDDVVYLDANLVVRGGITMYAENEVDIPSILDSLPIASNTALGIASFDSTYFSVDSNGMVSLTSAPSSGASTLGELLNVDSSIDATASVDRVLYQPAGSAMWTWRELPKDGVVGNYLPLSGGTVTGIVSFSKSILLLGSGNGTYNIGEINSTSTVGLYIEAPLNSDSWNASRLPITLSWRGGYDNHGGLRITNSDEAYLGGNKILHAGNYSSYALPLSGGTVDGNVLADYFNFKKHDGSNESAGYIGLPSSNVNDIAIVSTTSSPIKIITGDYSNPRIIVNPNGNVGIGTTNPQNKLDVNGYVEANSFILDGYGAQTFTIGVVGVGAGGLYLEGPWYDNTATQKLPITISWRGGFNNQGGIKLDASANMLVTGGITMYSDQRKKTILNNVELSLKQIANAPLIQHYYNSDQNKTTHVGSIAQYWAGLNDWFCKLDNEGYYTMEIQNCALASAISIARHLERYESKTDKTIRKMKKRIQELEDEVERLKNN